MKLLEKYNINIKNKDLLELALTHSSYGNEHHTGNYERLEFLGDAVLEFIVSIYFFNHTSGAEGMLSKLRANYVCEKALATYAKDMGLDKYIRIGTGQYLSDAIIADVFESVLAVIYLDQGLDVAIRYCNEIILPYTYKVCDFSADYKSLFQEMVQSERKSVQYVVLDEDDKTIEERFTVCVKVDGIVFGTGKGKNKKEAEQKAAFDALSKGAR